MLGVTWDNNICKIGWGFYCFWKNWWYYIKGLWGGSRKDRKGDKGGKESGNCKEGGNFWPNVNYIKWNCHFF